MRMSISVIGAAMAASLTISGASAQSAGGNLRMACHMPVGGVLMKEPTIYEVVGDSLFVTGMDARRKISTAGAMLPLGTVRDARGPIASFATHSLKGKVLVRSVYEQRPGKARRLFFTERFDFARSTVIGADGKDNCHARWP